MQADVPDPGPQQLSTIEPVIDDAPAEIVSAAGDAIITIDRQARITGWNPSAERLFGWSRQEASGRQVDMIAGDDRRSELMSLVVPKVLAGETVATYDTVRRRKDGSTFDASVTAFPLRDRAGEVIGAASITRDISERIRLRTQREILQRITDAALAHLDTDSLLHELTTRLADAFQFNHVAVTLLDRSREVLVVRAVVGAGSASPSEIPLGAGFAGRVAAARRPLVVEDASTVEIIDPAVRAAARSLVGIPLISRGELLGVLAAATPARRRFEQDDLILLRLAGDRLALALDHASAFERAQSDNLLLQRSLLPDALPEIGGIELAVHYRAAAGQVGGDFYDVVPAPGGGLLAFIGDVCGNGIPAAAMTGMARHTLRALAMRPATPARIIRELNAAILRLDSRLPFMTAAVAAVTPTPDAAQLAIVLGGHPKPLLVRSDGDAAPIGRFGTLLGVYPQVELHTVRADLRPGDAVLLYTDGVTEARIGGEQFGERRLVEAAGVAAGDAEQIVRSVERAVLQHQPNPRDDLALLCIRVRQADSGRSISNQTELWTAPGSTPQRSASASTRYSP
ncbi:MAG TPA: SpoIIE family protein phosphatase [Gaiellales bacterium]|nr:SpoIIE family protein phosphatase [Gaiellales bacterium]